MAITVERMVAVLEARMDKFEKGVDKARKQAVGDFAAITTAGTNMEKSINGLAANSNKAFGNGAKGAQQFQRAMNTSRLETANLAAQLNDIGVQLAGGQSPFLIALQQGTQINQVLGQGGARAAVGALAGAFTSLINPVSIATIAIIGLGGTAIQYFSTLFSEGEKSEETLKRQADLIRALAKEWGDTIPAIRQYADEMERAQKIADLQAGAELINSNTLEETRAAIADAGIEIADLVSQLQGAGAETEVIVGLQKAFNDFSDAASDGSLRMEDVQRVQDALATAIDSVGIPALDAFRLMFDELSASALGAAGSVQALNAQTGGATTGLFPSQGAYRGVQRDADGTIQNGGFTTPENGPTPGRRPLIELEGLPGSDRQEKSRAKAISEAERERKAVADLIEQLEFEQSTIGMTDAQRAEANALRRAGAAATDEQKAKISELVEATYAERDALKASKDAMEELRSVGRDVLEGMVSDLRAGKSAADIFANALGRIADKLVSGGLDAIFGGAGGGLFGSLFGGGMKGTSYFPPAPRAMGGPVTAGTPYIVGEKRPELFVPNVSGTIIPKVPNGGGPVSVDARTTFQASGNRETDQEMMRALARRDAELPSLIIKTVRDAQKRRAI